MDEVVLDIFILFFVGDVCCMYCMLGMCDNVINMCISCFDGFYGDMCK